MNNLSDEKTTWFYHQLTALSKRSFQNNLKYQKLEEIPPMNDDDEKVFIFTHGAGTHERSLDKMVKTAIDTAVQNKEYILLSSFVINNTEILEKLKEACRHLPGKVYILVGRTEPISVSYNYSGNISYGGLNELAKHGGLIRKKEHAHLKFLVSGSKFAIIMTTNITTEGLTKNPEFGLVIKDQSIIRALKRLFMILWTEKSENILIQGDWKKAPTWSPVKKRLTERDSFHPKLILSSEILKNEINEKEQILRQKSLLTVIKDLIAIAKKNIQISAYLIILKKDDPLTKLLLEKAKEGIKIQILVPQVKVQINPKMESTLNYLESNNINIRYYRELHGKMIIIDQKKCLLFTGNLDKYLKSDNSYDIGIEIQNPAIISNMTTLFEHLWNEASTEYEKFAPINLDMDLVILSEDSISPRHRNISVITLEKIIQNNEGINWFLNGDESKLRIYGLNRRIFYICMDHRTVDDYDEFTQITAKIKSRTSFKDKEAVLFSVNELRLRLLWESDIIEK